MKIPGGDDERIRVQRGEEKKETLTYYEHDLREVKKAGQVKPLGF